MPQVKTSWKTDVGRRQANEDSALVMPASELPEGVDALLVIADGMGGRASGEIASTTAVTAVRDAFCNVAAKSSRSLADVLNDCLLAANDAVYRKATSDPALDGMGTTCVAVAFSGSRVFYSHLGDSRAYFLRDGRLRRLTEDHSFVAEKVKSGEITEDQARKSRFRNVITRAVGLESTAQPESGSLDLKDGDVVLLCTDGLSGPVSDGQIVDILCSSPDPDEVCSEMVRTALKNGGSDNVTVVIATYGTVNRRDAKPQPKETVRQARKGSWLLPALVGLVLGAGLGIYPGHMYLGKYLPKPAPEKPATAGPKAPSVTPTSYDAPVAMLYAPLRPGLLALDPQGYLHAVDMRGQVTRIDTSGQVVLTSPVDRTLLPTTADTASSMVACDVSGSIYISDPSRKTIRKIGADGRVAATIGAGKLEGPGALAIGPDGSIYVIDGGRLKVIHPHEIPAAEPVGTTGAPPAKGD